MRGRRRRQDTGNGPARPIRRGLADLGSSSTRPGRTGRAGAARAARAARGSPPSPGPSGGPGHGRHRSRRHTGRRIVLTMALFLAVAVPAGAVLGRQWLGHLHPSQMIGTALTGADRRGDQGRASRSGNRPTPVPASTSPSGSARPSATRRSGPAGTTPSAGDHGSTPGTATSGSSTPGAGGTTAARYEREVAEAVNAVRVKAGCGALRYDTRLATAAREHSADMARRGYFDHNTPDGVTPWERAKAQGYQQPSAENIAAGQPSPAAVVKAWMSSPGHRANILNCSSHATGVGFHRGGHFGFYWTQMFGYR